MIFQTAANIRTETALRTCLIMWTRFGVRQSPIPGSWTGLESIPASMVHNRFFSSTNSVRSKAGISHIGVSHARPWIISRMGISVAI
jgi:hypothetical protein